MGAGRAPLRPEDSRARGLDGAFDPEAFRASGHALVDRLAEYLSRLAHPGGRAPGEPALPVLPPHDPEALLARWPGGFSSGGDGRTTPPEGSYPSRLDPAQ